jgi:hypothetical protein
MIGHCEVLFKQGDVKRKKNPCRLTRIFFSFISINNELKLYSRSTLRVTTLPDVSNLTK